MYTPSLFLPLFLQHSHRLLWNCRRANLGKSTMKAPDDSHRAWSEYSTPSAGVDHRGRPQVESRKSGMQWKARGLWRATSEVWLKESTNFHLLHPFKWSLLLISKSPRSREPLPPPSLASSDRLVLSPAAATPFPTP